MTETEIKAMERRQQALIQKHWKHEGVKAVVALIETECAILQGRACQPGATAHDAGQGFALQQVVAKLQRKKWERLQTEAGD